MDTVSPVQGIPRTDGLVRVAEIVLDEALERWWEGDTDDIGFSRHSLPTWRWPGCHALGCDKFWLLDNLGAAHPAKYCTWGWRKLPRQIKQLIINFALNGKPLEFLGPNRRF